MKSVAPSILNLPIKKKRICSLSCLVLSFLFHIRCMHSPWIRRWWSIVLPTAVKSFIVAGKPWSSDRTKGDRLWIWMSICCHPHWSSKSTDNATKLNILSRICWFRYFRKVMWAEDKLCFTKVSVPNDIFLSYYGIVTSECHLLAS